MKIRFAFAGFRHPHVLDLWEGVKNHPGCEIVAACEGDPAARTALEKEGRVRLTHDNFESMLAETACDVMAVGDVYAERGRLVVAALESGRHVIADKPICTRLTEWKRIQKLSRERRLVVGCQLDLTEFPALRRVRELIQTGQLGTICTITILAQHPLRLDRRASWYFEKGSHGGTINDIGVHVMDLAPWLTGRNWSRLLSARTWNAKAATFPHFQDCTQIHGLLEGDIACFADLSYLAPDTLGYELPQYWRVTVHGTGGMAEASATGDRVLLARNDDATPQILPSLPAPPRQYLEDFLADLGGSPRLGGLDTARVLAASRLALEAQHAADTSGDHGIPFA